MFLFNSKAPFNWSFRNYFLDSDTVAIASFFSGPIPNTLDDVPFDIQDWNEVFANSDYAMEIEGLNADDNAKQDTMQYTRFNTYNKLGRVRRHCPARYGHWELVPRRIIHGGYINPETRVPFNEAAHADSETQLRSLHFALYYSNNFRADEWDSIQYTSNFRGSVPWNRSAQQAPLIFEYDDTVTVHGIEYFSWTSANNAPRFWTMEVWDPALNGGAGDWAPTGNQDLQMWDTLYYRTFLECDTPVTGSRFRVTFSDTGGGSWAFNHIALHGDEPAWGKDPVDLTWALVGTGYNARSGYFERSFTDSFEQVGQWPWILVDVGIEGSGAAIELNQSTGLVGGDTPMIENFTLNFLDN